MTKKTYFISDLHLGASYLTSPLDYERRVVRFLDSIASTADRLYLLGDIIDYWYEYRTVVPRGYTRFLGTLARLADSGVKITWFIGNHDIWLFDYISSEIGLKVVDGYETVTIGHKKFFLSHGDGLGKLPPAFRLLRATFRNKLCQKLFAAIHPRWTIPFAHRWSDHSRHYSDTVPQFEGEDSEPLIEFSRNYLRDTDPGIDYFVYGHRHILLDYPLGIGNSRMIILGDWIHHFSYATFDGNDISLHIFKE
ncbi:MAG: UDP-2,3-diacylglucosamine diphosphatase [Muribaculaceae bacterium]|nr:UDP-2,3-diacylglucosamine diphosphatase [Muribaculaceae bacterium]